MYFDERKIGNYRVYTGALESPQGDGYIGALIVHQERNGSPLEVLRDESLACGHRWPSANEAMAYAMTKARDLIRRESPALAC
jgi:hypothetical protein